jgi:hypothetical protein
MQLMKKDHLNKWSNSVIKFVQASSDIAARKLIGVIKATNFYSSLLTLYYSISSWSYLMI